MADSYLPPRLRGRMQQSRWALPVGQPEPEAPETGGGILGTGVGPNVNLGLGQLASEIGMGVTGLSHFVTSLAPGGEPAGEFYSRAGKGMASSLVGTALTLEDLNPAYKFANRKLGDLLGNPTPEETTTDLLGEQYQPKDFFARASERGVLPALVEDVGNVSLVAAGVTAPVKAASVASRLGGATEASARLAAVHESLLSNPAIHALQHPYITAGKALRETVTAPALARKLAAYGVEAPNPDAVDFLRSELPDNGVDYSKVQVDMDRHARTAEAYNALPDTDEAARPAYEAFRNEFNEQYRHLTEDLGVKVEMVDEDPYPSAAEMIADVRDNKRLKVYKTKSGEDHPFLTAEENDRFRAVHDAFGHAATGRHFDRHGEEAAFLAHNSMFSEEAAKAMATETRGQNSVLISEGTFPKQKLALLPDDLASPAEAIAQFQRQQPTGLGVGAGTRFLAGVEEQFQAHEARRTLMQETRLADKERREAARTPAVITAVETAREHLIDEGRRQGITISRQKASLILGDEMRSRMTGLKALEDEYRAKGLPEEVFIRKGIREHFIPKELDTPELQARLAEMVAAQLDEEAKIRATYESSRPGSKGLQDEDLTEPEPSKRDKEILQQAERTLKKAYSDVQGRKIARQAASQDKRLAKLQARHDRLAHDARQAGLDASAAVAEFDHTREWTPKAWKTAQGLTASAQSIYERTIADVAKNNGEWGGSSFNPHENRFVVGGHDNGFAVGVVEGTALEVPFEEFSAAHVEQVARAHQDLFRNPGTIVGTWMEKGVVHIDPSQIVDSLDEALLLGGARRQLSIYDIAADDVVNSILPDRPDIALALVGRHENFSRRAAELRDIAEKTAMSKGDPNTFLEYLAMRAAAAQDLGLVKHPDEFFSKHVAKFEFAKRGSRKGGVLRQMVLERAGGTPAEGMKLWRDIESSVSGVRKVMRWYHESHDLVEQLFRDQADVTLLDGTKINPADLFYQVLAVNSFQATPRDNLTRAMFAFQKYSDLPAKERAPLVAAMKKVTAGKATLEDAFAPFMRDKVSVSKRGKRTVRRVHDLSEKFEGAGLYAEPKQYLTEIFAGRGIDTWNPETLAEASAAFEKKGKVPDRAKALAFITENYPDLIARIGEDAAVKEFWGSQHRAKIITFHDNLKNPETSLGVTMDQQMMRLFGVEMPASGGGDAWIRYSEQVRDLADQLSEVFGERVMPHEVQAAMWVFAKDEVNRLQFGHFHALADDAADMVRNGERITDDTDPIQQWIDEASAPYKSDESRVVVEHRIKRGDTEAVEPVVYRPGWGALNQKDKVALFEKRRVKWLAARVEINAALALGDTTLAAKNFNRFVTDMETKTPKSLGLFDDASGASFFDIWQDTAFHTDAFKAAANTLDLNPGGLLQSFKNKVLGEFVPLDDGTRGLIRVFESGNFHTLVHEDGHLLKTMLLPGDLAAVERAYGISDGVWKVEHQENFTNDLTAWMQGAEAPKGLVTTFERIRTVLRETWDMVKGTFQRRRVHPELATVFEKYLNPAERTMPADEYLGLKMPEPETGTLPQRAARPPRFAEPPAGKQDWYNAGRRGQKALSRLEKAAARSRDAATASAVVEREMAAIQKVLDEGKLPAQLEQDAMAAAASRSIDAVNRRLGSPSIPRTPARYQPLWQAVLDLGDEAKSSPEFAGILDDLPETLHEIQQRALDAGFDPVHVRDFTPTQVRRLVFGNMRLGLGRDILHEAEAGTRKTRTGALSRAGGVDRSLEAFLAAAVEATAEKRTNNVVSWVEQTAARQIKKGDPIPSGWAMWDPIRTRLLTGQEVSPGVSTAAQTAMIVPEAVVRTIDRYTKDFDHWAFRAIRKATSPWRTLVLTLSPGWYVRNIAGNVALAATEGVSLKDWSAAWKSYRSTDAIGHFADIPFVTSDTLAQEALAAVDDSVIPRHGIGEAMSEGGRVRGAAQHVSRRMLRVNEVVDEFARAAVYHRGLRLNMPVEQAWSRAKEALVDYNALSPFERTAVRSVIPFYTWQKGILKVVAGQAIDHPARVALTMLLGRMQEDYIAERLDLDKEDIPDYYKHLVGKYNVRSFNPFADPADILSVEGITRSMNPFIELALRKGMGAPEFYSEKQRLGYFGAAQQDVDVPSALTEMVTRSPGGRIVSTGPGQNLLGLNEVDDSALRSRFLKARKQVRGIDNPEATTDQEKPSYLPPRLRPTG